MPPARTPDPGDCNRAQPLPAFHRSLTALDSPRLGSDRCEPYKLRLRDHASGTRFRQLRIRLPPFFPSSAYLKGPLLTVRSIQECAPEIQVIHSDPIAP